LMLKMGRPFLLPRLYERTAAALQHEGMLVTGMQSATLAAEHFLPAEIGQESVKTASAVVPGRPEIRDMADSDQPDKRLLAFKLMTSVINYDLSAEPVHRRISQAFDEDWRLYLEVAQKNGLRLPGETPPHEPIESCSCRQFDEGKAVLDAFGEADGFWNWLGRESRSTAFGANR